MSESDDDHLEISTLPDWSLFIDRKIWIFYEPHSLVIINSKKFYDILILTIWIWILNLLLSVQIFILDIHHGHTKNLNFNLSSIKNSSAWNFSMTDYMSKITQMKSIFRHQKTSTCSLISSAILFLHIHRDLPVLYLLFHVKRRY